MKLNKEQLKAIKQIKGIELVIAGAGTGKTRILIEKVKNIISNGQYKPENILVLTFSQKASLEIKERINKSSDKLMNKMFVGTFHSFCYMLIKENSNYYINKFNYTKVPSILDENKKFLLLNDIIKPELENLYGLPASLIFNIITHNNKKLLIQLKIKNREIYETINKIFNNYTDYKRENNFIDFYDLIDLTILLLKKNKIFQNQLINRYQYILIDEFQDTSENNLDLLKLLLPPKKINLFVVGDDYQSIYQFRNANVKIIINFKKYFENVKLYKLKTNYRSYKEIVNISNKLILNNKYKIKKKLVSKKGKGGIIEYYPVDNFIEQVSVIKKIISENEKFNLKIAVLYRNNLTGNKLKAHLKLTNQSNLELMTIHSAKGLEFESVIICDIVDGIIPAHLNDIEEERRLFYVALTRAQNNLYLLYYKNKINFKKPQFIAEIEKIF